MFYINWDTTSYHNNVEKSQKAPNTFVFYQDNWDDYGYHLTYTVCYYDQNLNEVLLGNYRIYNPNIESQVDEFERKWISVQIHNDRSIGNFYKLYNEGNIKNINNDYYSLAHDISFYQNLYILGSNYYEEFLKVFRDLTVIDLPKEIKENEGVKKALLRNDSVTNILKLNNKLKELEKRLNVRNFTDYIFTSIDNNQEELKRKIEETISDLVRETPYSYNLLNNLVYNYANKNFNDQDLKVYNFLSSLLGSSIYLNLKTGLDSCVDENLRIILNNVNTIKKTLSYNSDDKNFIHYTSLNTLNFLLPNKKNKVNNNNNNNNEENSYPKLRLSNARQMNDPNEGYTFLELIGVKKEELPVTDYETSSFYFASMSQIGDGQNLEDSLPMWKQYGDDAKGINLTYHSDYIQALVNDGIEIYRVCYNVSKEKQEFKDAIGNIKEQFKIIRKSNDNEKQQTFFSALRLIDSIRYLFKEEDYSYENEYRIIKSYEGKEHEVFPFTNANSVIPRLYVKLNKKLKYSKIKLGPKCEDIDFIAPYIKYVDPDIEVTRSEISYR